MIKNKIKYILIFSISIFSLACSNSDLEENPNFADSEIFGNWADTVQPVSYTHLDVYKRQMYRKQLPIK